MAKPLFARLLRIVKGADDDADADGPLLEASLSRLERWAHFWVLVIKSFVRNRCLIRASALSYSTLLALIPILAVALSVTSSILKDAKGEERINGLVDSFVAAVIPPADYSSDTPDDVNASIDSELGWLSGDTNTPAPAASGPVTPDPDAGRVHNAQREAARYIHDFIKNTHSGALGTLGMILLVSVAIRMLANIEATFNDIWGVPRGRNWFVRVVQYWAVITLGPLLLVFALGLAGGPHLQTTRTIVSEMPVIGSLVFQLLPLLLLWLVFTVFYQLVPNTKVHFSAALVGGMVAGSLWYLNNVFGFLYVSRVVTNSKIYGSLGLVPVFMAGLYLSWMFLLFGAQVAYAYQNRSSYLQDKLVEHVNQRGREFVALRLMTCLGQRFQNGLPAVSISQMSTELAIPSRLVEQVMRPLLAARLVVEVAGKESAYHPARPLETINCHHVLMALRSAQGQEVATRDEPVRAEVLGEFARIQAAEESAATSVSMLALVHRAQARLELAPAIPADAKAIPPAPEPETETETLPPLSEALSESDSETPPETPAATITEAIAAAEAPPAAPPKTKPEPPPEAKPEEPSEDKLDFPL